MAYSYNSAPMSQWSPGKSYEEASDPTGIKALDRGEKRDQLDFTNKLATDKAQLDKETLADAQLKNKIAMLKFLGKGPRGDLISDILNQDLAGGGMFNVDKNNPQEMQAMVTALQGLDPNDNGTVNPAALQSIVQMGLGPDVADDPSIGNEGSASESRFDAGGSAGGTGAPASDVSGKFKIHQLGTPSTTPPPGGTPWKQGGSWNIGADDLMNTAEDRAESEAFLGQPEKLRDAIGALDPTNPAVRAGMQDQVSLADSMNTVAELFDPSYAGIVSGTGEKLKALFHEVKGELKAFDWGSSTEAQQANHRAKMGRMLQHYNEANPPPFFSEDDAIQKRELIKFRRWQNAVQNMVMLAVTKRGGKALTATEIALISSSYGQGQGAHYMKAALIKWQGYNYRELRGHYDDNVWISQQSRIRQSVLSVFTPDVIETTPAAYAALLQMTEQEAEEYGVTHGIHDPGTASHMTSPRQQKEQAQAAGTATGRPATTAAIAEGMAPAARAIYDAASPAQQKLIIQRAKTMAQGE